jgi:hypothetical protein
MSWAVLDDEIKPEQLVNPLMLGNSGQPLIQEKLQAIVVSADEDAAPPKVRSPMPHDLNQADQFMFVGSQLDVAGGKGPAEEGQGTCPLVKNNAESGTRSVAVHHELAIKIRHLQHRGRREGALEGRKGLSGLRRPGERLLTQEASEWHGDGAKILDELPVVARQP